MDVIDDILLFNEMDIINNIERRPYNTINRFRHVDNFHEWDETDFVRRFRLSKASVLVVLELIQGDIRARTNRNNPIAPLQQLLLTLRFFASGSFYITVSDFGGIHKSTAAQIIKRTVTALSYLITPINNPQGEIETLFNESLIRTRTVVERTFGIWKRRFPILSVGMRCRVELAQNIIVATAVIHNIARQERDAIDDLEDDPLIENVLAPPPRNDNDNHHHRRELLEYFEQLYNHRN
ncbi:hypothetical protein PPYR_04806 [Photinus pyralis]|uniref:DDE Tnp4 domain-containing protein n=1 Tax=Photinus pyralis TaxID=7054 RepID=A0A5N4AZN7_PHOPY|nr:hypothetical protein PPYR_04806 [Photinus pyralis]